MANDIICQCRHHLCQKPAKRASKPRFAARRHKLQDDVIDVFVLASRVSFPQRRGPPKHTEHREFAPLLLIQWLYILFHTSSNTEFFESSAYGSGTPSSDYPSSPAAGGHASGISIINPIEVGIMSATAAEAQILEYQTVFTQRFPFVVVPVTTSVQHCWQQHPLVCLAVLAVTSRDDTKRQKTLFKLLNEAVASRLVNNGPFASLDLLQALLIQVAWQVHHPPSCRRDFNHG